MDELDAAELALAELTARVDQVLALHKPCCRPELMARCSMHEPGAGAPYCRVCGWTLWPCPTVRALDPHAADPSVRPLGGAIAAHPGG